MDSSTQLSKDSDIRHEEPRWRILFFDVDGITDSYRAALGAHVDSVAVCRRIGLIQRELEVCRPSLVVVAARPEVAIPIFSSLRSAIGAATIPTIVLGAREVESTGDALKSGLSVDQWLPGDVEDIEFVARILGLLSRSKFLLELSADIGLPGSTWTLRQVQRRIDTAEEYSLLYFGIDRFKSVVDVYGFGRAGEFLRAMGDALRGGADLVGHPRVDIGHIGGDDFLAICSPDQVLQFSRYVVTKFEAVADLLYDPADLRRGYLEIPNRWGTGTPRRAALATLSVGVAQSTREGRRFTSWKVAAAVASEMKKVAKSQPGSYVCIDRRRSDDEKDASNNVAAA